jgi:hypothetical protein
MKIPLIAALAVVCLALARGAPQMRIEDDGWNFGRVTNAMDLYHGFVITNSGDGDLLIGHVLSSCVACLDAEIDRTNVPPGQSAMVSCHLNLKGLSGEIHRQVLLVSNDPHGTNRLLGINGTVVPAYLVVPLEPVLDLAQESYGEVQIFPLIDTRLPLAQVKTDNTNLEVRIRQVAQNYYQLELRPKASLPRHDADFKVTVQGMDTNGWPCEISGHIHNPPDLEVLPDHLVLMPVDKPQFRIIWVRQHTEKPFILLDVAANLNTIHSEVVREGKPFDYRINLMAVGMSAQSGKTNWLELKMAKTKSDRQSYFVPIVVN